MLTILMITLGTVAVVNTVISHSSSQSVKVETHQSNPSSTPVVSITVIPGPTTFPTPDPSVIEEKLEQANEQARQQVDAQRQQAIDQVNRQFDQADQQLEAAKIGLPEVASSLGNPMITQQQEHLEQQRQRMIDQLEQHLQWPE